MRSGHALSTTRSQETLDGLRVCLAFGASYLAVTASVAAGLSVVGGCWLVAVSIALICVGARPSVAVGCGLLGWLFVTGFLVNQEGVLHLAGLGDLWRLLVMVAVPLAASAVGRRGSTVLAARRGR